MILLVPSHTSRVLDLGCRAAASLHAVEERGFDNLLGVDRFLEKDIES